MIATITRMTTSVPRPIYMSTCLSGSATVGRHSSYVRQPPPGPVLVRGFLLFFLSVGSTNPPNPFFEDGGVNQLLPMHCVLGLVDRRFDFLLGLVDHLFDLVLSVVDLLLGLTKI